MAYKRNIFMNKELIADIRNKPQPPRTALNIISQGKEVPKEFIKTAKRDLDEVERLLKSEIKYG
jgi:hypothetical protein